MGTCSIICTNIITHKKEVNIENITNNSNDLKRTLSEVNFPLVVYLQLRIKRFLKQKRKEVYCIGTNKQTNDDQKNSNTVCKKSSDRKIKQHKQINEKEGVLQKNNLSANELNISGPYDMLAQQIRNSTQDNQLIQQDPFTKKLTTNRSQDNNDPRSGPNDNKRRKYPKIQEDDFIYEGEWKNGKRDGLGILSMKNISKFIGEFVDNSVYGFGVLYHANQDKFIGNWVDFRATGPGYFIKQNSSYSRGYWQNDILHGFGIENWLKGDYIGDYNQGNKEGIGELIFDDKGLYKGEFHSSSLSGIGTFIFKDNRKYEGEWKNNKMNGYGMITMGDQKSFYEGEFVDDRREGFGVFYTQKKIFVGIFKNSKLDGEIILIENGVIKKQYWENGKTLKNLPQSHKILYEQYVNDIIDSQYKKIKKV